MNFSILTAALPQVLSTLVATVNIAERLFPAKGSGEQKLDYTLDHVKNTLEAVPELHDQAAAITARLEPVVGHVVSLFNDLGAFKPGGAPAPVHDPAPAAPVGEPPVALAVPAKASRTKRGKRARHR